MEDLTCLSFKKIYKFSFPERNLVLKLFLKFDKPFVFYKKFYPKNNNVIVKRPIEIFEITSYMNYIDFAVIS